MSGLVMNRRAVLAASAGLLVGAGLPAAALSAAAPLSSDAVSARMIAAWVVLRPEAGATVRLAFLGDDGRPLGELPPVQFEAAGDQPASLWRQAQEAGAVAQALAVAALASAWGVPSRDCEIRSGFIAHPRSGAPDEARRLGRRGLTGQEHEGGGGLASPPPKDAHSPRTREPAPRGGRMQESKTPLRAVLGIDAAWTATEPSGVALAVETKDGWRLATVDASYGHFLERRDGADLGLGRPRGATAEAARLIAAVSRLVGQAPDCVAIDMPVGPQPITGRRACDNAISRRYGGRKAAVHSPNAVRPGPISDALRAGFAALGFPVCLAPPAHGLIEVYPHAALIEFMSEKERRPYKAAKTTTYWPGLPIDQRHRKLRGVWARIVEALDSRIAGTAAALPVPPEGVRGWALKAFEDKLDAVVCAAVAIAALSGEAVSHGDADGAIWVPSTPSPSGRRRREAPDERAPCDFLSIPPR